MSKECVFFCITAIIYYKIHIFLEYANYSISFFKKSAFCKVELAKYTLFTFFYQIIW